MPCDMAHIYTYVACARCPFSEDPVHPSVLQRADVWMWVERRGSYQINRALFGREHPV